MKVTVIIPLYNGEGTIVDSIKSVLNQTKIELVQKVIIINDGSTDDSKKIVENFINKYKGEVEIQLLNQKNQGVSAARNRGLDNSETEWVAFLDSDDIWLEKKLEKQFIIIKENPQIDILGGNLDEKSFSIFGWKFPYLHEGKIKEILFKNFPQPSTVVLKRQIYLEVGGFDINQKYAEDGNFFLKICGQYRLFHLQEKLVQYDGGKRGFGQSGLSGNMKEMYLGNMKNLADVLRRDEITYFWYAVFKILFRVKYLRRKLINRLGKRG